MKKIVNISLLLIAFMVPSYFLAMQQPTSLKEKAAAIVSESIKKAELEELKKQLPEDVYNIIAKKALSNIAKSSTADDIWQAVKEIKKLSNEELDSDTELAGNIIEALAENEKYKNNFNKLYRMVNLSEQHPGSPIYWDDLQGEEPNYFTEDAYIKFAAQVLDTSGAHEWIKNFEESIIQQGEFIPSLAIDYKNKPEVMISE